jgi:hypothetical protein
MEAIIILFRDWWQGKKSVHIQYRCKFVSKYFLSSTDVEPMVQNTDYIVPRISQSHVTCQKPQ